jgi:hypothetical protein
MEEPFMKKFILVLLAMEMAGFLGCAISTELVKGGKLFEITNDDYSTVYMSRESRVWGYLRAYPMLINGVYLFRIGSGDCVTFKIPTGESEIDLVPGMKQVRFMSEKGKKYYFYVSSKGPELRQLTEEEWNEKQKACNWVDLKE